MRNMQAFTLIELLFTVAIAAILSMLAAPSFQHLLAHEGVTQANNQLVKALHVARQLAVTHGTNSILCPSVDQQHCSPSQRWQGGWLVAIDRDKDGQPDAGPNRVFESPAERIRIHSSRGRLRVRFHADGSAPGSNLSLIVCLADKPDTATSVVVSNAGRSRQGTPSTAQAQACSQS